MTAFFAPIPTPAEADDNDRRRRWHRFLLGTAVVWGLIGLSQSDVSDVAVAGASTSAFISHCHSSAEDMAWCEWVIWLETPGARAYFEWVTAPKVTTQVVSVPATLQRIAWCEAGKYLGLPRYQTNYRATNMAGSSASGGYQILDGTWAAWKHYVPGAHVYARALHAPPSVQDAVAVAAYHRHGTSPWNASRGCWA